MNKIYSIILQIISIYFLFSCGNSIHSGLYGSKSNEISGFSGSMLKEKNSTYYYVVTDVITPNGVTLSYNTEMKVIYSQNNNYNLVQIDSFAFFKVSASCISPNCTFLSNEKITAIESDSFVPLLSKLNYPDQITNVADEKGYRYNAYKLFDNSDITHFIKMIEK